MEEYILTSSSIHFQNEIKQQEENLFNSEIPTINYTSIDENKYKLIERVTHQVYGEITIIEDTNKDQYMWKEIKIDVDKNVLAHKLALVEHRKKLNEIIGGGLVKLETVMYKKVDYAWASSQYRMRYLFKYYEKNVREEIKEAEKKVNQPNQNLEGLVPSNRILKMFETCLKVLEKLHSNNIYMWDLRPDHICCDAEYNFYLLDTTIGSLESPVKRLRAALNNNKPVYLHPKIYKIFHKKEEDEYLEDFQESPLKDSFDTFSLALIVLEYGTIKPQNYLYSFDGSFNLDLLKDRLRLFTEQRKAEIGPLCVLLEEILLDPLPADIPRVPKLIDRLEKLKKKQDSELKKLEKVLISEVKPVDEIKPKEIPIKKEITITMISQVEILPTLQFNHQKKPKDNENFQIMKLKSIDPPKKKSRCCCFLI